MSKGSPRNGTPFSVGCVGSREHTPEQIVLCLPPISCLSSRFCRDIHKVEMFQINQALTEGRASMAALRSVWVLMQNILLQSWTELMESCSAS